MAQNSENCNKTLQKLHKTKQQITTNRMKQTIINVCIEKCLAYPIRNYAEIPSGKREVGCCRRKRDEPMTS